MNWAPPAAGQVHILSATAAPGNSVTLNWRYEPPTANPPRAPSNLWQLTSSYGLNQVKNTGNSGYGAFGACGALVGCTVTLTGVPSGTQTFTLTANWALTGLSLGSLSGTATVVVP